jgi:hypothetical protein
LALAILCRLAIGTNDLQGLRAALLKIRLPLGKIGIATRHHALSPIDDVRRIVGPFLKKKAGRNAVPTKSFNTGSLALCNACP